MPHIIDNVTSHCRQCDVTMDKSQCYAYYIYHNALSYDWEKVAKLCTAQCAGHVFLCKAVNLNGKTLLAEEMSDMLCNE